MKILGIDPANISGWSSIVDGKLDEFGNVICPPNFTIPQALNYYHNEFTRLINRLQPDYIAIEDVLLAISGVKTLVKLSRINGVIIQSAFATLKDRVFVYMPTHWKSHSVDGLRGDSPKWKILFETVKYFELIDQTSCDRWVEMIYESEIQVSSLKIKWELLREELNKLKTANTRKRNPLTENEKLENENKIKILTKQIVSGKAAHKDQYKKSSNELMKIGNEICAQTGISFDIADSICMALCAQREITNG